jgi:pyruvate/2-oxoglutarate dehydrogenase complex dihydrolipoamide acyltransferase (E2) component
MNILDLKRKAQGFMPREGTAWQYGSSATPQALAWGQLAKTGALDQITAQNQAAAHPANYVWSAPTLQSPGAWVDPSQMQTQGFLGQTMQKVGDALPTVAPLAIAAGAGYGAGLFGTGAASVAAPSAGGLLDTPIIDAAGNLVGGEMATGAVTSSPVYMGSTGGLLPLASAAGAASVTPAATAATPAASAAPVAAATAPATNSALADSAANSAGYGASSAGAGLGAGASVGGAMTADDLLKLASDNKGLIGAALGALGSGNSQTSTTANKDPWAPAQAWMKSNLGLGQALQAQYAANPFSQYQQQAYNNQSGLGNAFRGAVNGLTQQMNNFHPYQRTPQSQVVNPYQFQNPNLGFTSKPFGGA